MYIEKHLTVSGVTIAKFVPNPLEESGVFSANFKMPSFIEKYLTMAGVSTAKVVSIPPQESEVYAIFVFTTLEPPELIYVIIMLSVRVSSLLESYKPQNSQIKVEKLRGLQIIQAEAERREEEQEDMPLLHF